MPNLDIATRKRKTLQKLSLDLGTARTNTVIATNVNEVKILDKSTGTFTLTFVFHNGTTLDLANTEVNNGDTFQLDIASVRLTNTAQSGITLKLLISK